MNQFMSTKRPEELIDIGNTTDLGHNEIKYANYNFNGVNVLDIKERKRKLIEDGKSPEDKRQKLLKYA